MSALLPHKGVSNVPRKEEIKGITPLERAEVCNADAGQQGPKAARPPLADPRLFVLAFVVAVLADIVLATVTLIPPLIILGDVAVALILCSILGFNWLFIPTLLVEAVPGLSLFPTWTIAVLALAGIKAIKRN